MAEQAAGWLNGVAGGLSDGLLAGVGSLGVSLLSGQGLTAQSGFQAAGAAIGAGIGFGAPGAMVGGLIGNVVGGLFGDDDPPEFGIDAGILRDANKSFNRNSGFAASATTYDPNFNETAKWVHPIFSAYSASIASIQEGFNAQVFGLAAGLPEAMKEQMLDSLAATDFSSILASASAGKWEDAQAEAALKGIAEKYAAGLVSGLGASFSAALDIFLATSGAKGVVGNDAVWGVLTDAVRQNIEAAFFSASAAIRGGNVESGIATITGINSSIAQIGQAMAPIAEILATDGLSDYERQIRQINIQFDQYATALQAAGVDLSKYTDLEKARAITLRDAAEVAEAAAVAVGGFRSVLEDIAKAADDALAIADDNLRNAFAAEQDRLAEQHESTLAGLNNQLDLAQESVSQLTALTGSLRSMLQGMRLETEIGRAHV